jgi:tetratricopeptide (TPR) repeat protein
MHDIKELLTNAEIAFANKQYDTALSWYQKVLEVTPDNIYALSRAGAICVPLGKFEEALLYFGRAMKLAPDNGDNAFNYGNACFFQKDYVKAFDLYVQAEKTGCSDDVKPRLYYQLALLCSMRQDIKSALVYFRKCEESDKTGAISLNPDLISEKLKLYMILKDYPNAETCAAQLVAINPTDFRNYMVYFSLLMAHKRYPEAEKLLGDAQKYATLTDENRFSLLMQTAALQNVKGDHKEAIRILEERKKAGGLTGDQLSQLLLALSEAHSKNGDQDKAIRLLQGMLGGAAYRQPAAAPAGRTVPAHDLTPEELEEMIRQDMDSIQEKIDSGEIDADMGLYAIADYDEEGNLVHYYDVRAFGSAAPAAGAKAEPVRPAAQSTYQLPTKLRETVVFTLLTCHLAKDEFAPAQKLANALLHSDNRYYHYFARYTAALTERKLTGNSDAANRKYAEAIAFFRNKTFSDATDTLASLFRARLYAEQGKYEKAGEIANLLSDTDRQAILDYISRCKQ